MITIEDFLMMSPKEIVKYITGLGYTQLSQIFSKPDFTGGRDYSTGKYKLPPTEKALAVLEIEDKNGAVTYFDSSLSGMRLHGGSIFIRLNPSKLNGLNIPAGVAIPDVHLCYNLYDTSKKISKAYIEADRHQDGVFDESAYWISEDLIFDRRPEYTKFGLGLPFDCGTQTVLEHIQDLYRAADTKGKIATEFCNRSFGGELKKEIEDLTGEKVAFLGSGLHHMIFCGFLEWCVKDGLDFSDLVALCAGQGIGVCSNTFIETRKLVQDEKDTLKQKADKVKNYFKSRGIKTKDQIVLEAYTDLESRLPSLIDLVASQYGLSSEDLSNVLVNGVKIKL